MHTVRLPLKKRSYDIVIGPKIMPSLGHYITRLNLGDSAFIITNSRIKKYCGRELINGLKPYGLTYKFNIVPDSEKSKDIRKVALLIKSLASFDSQKRTFVIALGGGVVGDLSGFIASVYKRGIPYIQIPTTLLAQVDSSIGGKTAVDLSKGKNLVGAFYQPSLVFSDISLLKTLSRRQISSGLSEVIKYGIIKNKALFEYLENHYKEIMDLRPAAVERIVEACSKIKANIVSSDEREEKGLRTILNFGHTIGHAIEAAAGFDKYNHGEAVGLGMLVALGISVKKGLIKEGLLKRAESLIKNVGLPVRISGVSLQEILRKHYRDKKFSGSKNKFVLISALGKTKIVTSIPLKTISAAINERL